MKEGWEYKTLGECCDILDRLRKPIKYIVIYVI